ncbi:Senescence-induced receptor-like serine/threonine-protein kinase [Acorus calamus]|uniref:Senescence-induced receptor-like serine/threonine-protein kinase n=2 Tax=Acorus calamus TaxID=4465 RepID=A0AAV9EH68_ACOCL|nr:Senescence-induced receptor-like serine/threonine-protein kinase [Acorus calamus]
MCVYVGFISIDCGCNESYVDGTTTIEYKSDDQYISTGESHNISPDEDNQDSWRALRTLRSFPTGVRNCYDIDIDISSGSGKGKGGKYLIRAVFYYGNYDSLNSAPEFDLYVGVNLWAVVQTSDNATVFELIMVARMKTVSVCLVNTGKGTPYISTIELRPLSDALYPAATVNTSLTFQGRVNFASATPDVIRYPKDKYDRRWFPISGEASLPPLDTRLTIEGNSGYDVPSVVMDTANSGDMYDLWTNVFKNPILGYYVYLHFMEIQILNASQSRLIDIYFNNKIFMTGFQPKYLYTDTIFNNEPLSEFPNAFYNLSTSIDSTLPPLLNAAELYAAVNWAIDASTFGQDVDAIQQIKWAYGIKRNWMGDPCLPHAYSWEGLACSNDNLPRIISLNLSSSGLNGKISTSFADLKLIQTLDLSSNNLVGNIPDFLAQLSSLTLLNLDNHHLSGSIPLPLLQRQSLTLRKGETRDGSFHLDNWEFADADVVTMTNNFMKEIGKGGFGTVYLGEKSDGTQVAVKRLKEMSRGSRMFLNEAKLLMKVRHKNIVPFVGYCNGVHKCLIYRYMSGGNLRDYLSDSNGAKDWLLRLKISLSVAKGLEYMHNGCEPIIVHRDIKPENILLNEKLEAKIADFGLGKMFPEENVTQVESSVKGTLGYLDPDDKYDRSEFTYFAGKPVHFMEALKVMHITDWVEKKLEMSDIVDPRLELSYHKMSLEKAIDLAKKCTLIKSSSRPTMGHVLSELTVCWEIEKAQARIRAQDSAAGYMSSSTSYSLGSTQSDNKFMRGSS